MQKTSAFLDFYRLAKKLASVANAAAERATPLLWAAGPPGLRPNPTKFRLVPGGRGHSRDSVLLLIRVCRAPGFCRLSPVGRREGRTVPRLTMGRPGRSPRVVRGF